MWDAAPSIVINGSTYTGQVLAGASFTFGASDLLANVQPPYGRISIVNIFGSRLPIDLNDSVTVTVDNAEKTARRTLFTGVITDISVTLLPDNFPIYDLTVVGRSQRYESRVIGELGFGEQYDAERFEDLVWAATGPAIDLISGTINGQTGSINGYGNLLGTATASPSTFAIVVPLPPQAVNAGQAIADFAQATSGWVWENRLGNLNFRPFDALSATSFTLPQGAIYLNGLQRVSTLTELYNDITILPNENDLIQLGDNYNAQDLTSQGDYGTRSFQLTTQYRHGPGAPYRWVEQGDYLLGVFANNIEILDSLAVDVTSDDLTNAVRNNLIECDMTQTVNFTLPSDIFLGGTGSAQIIGWQWTIADKILDLNINLAKVA